MSTCNRHTDACAGKDRVPRHRSARARLLLQPQRAEQALAAGQGVQQL